MSRQSPPDEPASTPTGTVDLTVVDGCLAAVAGALHDRPVQQLVVAGLMLQTARPRGGVQAAPPADADLALVDRAAVAITTAGQQSRDLMWALTAPVVRPHALEADVADAVARAAGPDDDLEVALDVEAADVEAVAAAVQIAHSLLVDVLLAGGHLRRTAVRSDAESVEATLVASAGTVDGPWVRLARARASAAGAQLEVAAEPTWSARITVPLPG